MWGMKEFYTGRQRQPGRARCQGVGSRYVQAWTGLSSAAQRQGKRICMLCRLVIVVWRPQSQGPALLRPRLWLNAQPHYAAPQAGAAEVEEVRAAVSSLVAAAQLEGRQPGAALPATLQAVAQAVQRAVSDSATLQASTAGLRQQLAGVWCRACLCWPDKTKSYSWLLLAPQLGLMRQLLPRSEAAAAALW